MFVVDDETDCRDRVRDIGRDESKTFLNLNPDRVLDCLDWFNGKVTIGGGDWFEFGFWKKKRKTC